MCVCVYMYVYVCMYVCVSMSVCGVWNHTEKRGLNLRSHADRAPRAGASIEKRILIRTKRDLLETAPKDIPSICARSPRVNQMATLILLYC